MAAARVSHSPLVYPALSLALNAGMRDAEIRKLTWINVDFTNSITVGLSKTPAGTGRTIPFNKELSADLIQHRVWYLAKIRGSTSGVVSISIRPRQSTATHTTGHYPQNSLDERSSERGLSAGGMTPATRGSQNWRKAAQGTKPSWTLPATSLGRCCPATATSGSKRSGEPSRRSAATDP